MHYTLAISLVCSSWLLFTSEFWLLNACGQLEHKTLEIATLGQLAICSAWYSTCISFTLSWSGGLDNPILLRLKTLYRYFCLYTSTGNSDKSKSISKDDKSRSTTCKKGDNSRSTRNNYTVNGSSLVDNIMEISDIGTAFIVKSLSDNIYFYYRCHGHISS